MEAEKVYRMKLSKIYPLLIAKAERKGRAKEEVDRLIRWLTGYDEAGLARQLEEEVDYGTFFREAPALNPAWTRITGTVCGCRVEEVEEPLMRQIAAWISWWTSWRKGKRWKGSWTAKRGDLGDPRKI